MKKIYKFLLLFIIILLTGCSGNYNLKINKDLSVKESVELSIDNENDAYSKTLKLFEDNKINKDQYKVNIQGEEIKIAYNDEFNSIEDYLINSKVYHQIFNRIQYNKTNKYIDLFVDENIKLKNNYNTINGSNLVDLDVIQVNIENPYKMNYTNAEMVNDNTYTWSIKKDDVSKKIQIQFKPSFNTFPYRPVIVGSLMLIVLFILIFSLIKRYKDTQRI